MLEALRHAVSGGRGLSRFKGLFSLQLRANQSRVDAVTEAQVEGVEVRVESADTLQRPEEQKKRRKVSDSCSTIASNFNQWGKMLFTGKR